MSDNECNWHGLCDAGDQLRARKTRSIPPHRPLRVVSQIQLPRLGPSVHHAAPLQNINMPLPTTDIEIRTMAKLPLRPDRIHNNHAYAAYDPLPTAMYTAEQELEYFGAGPLLFETVCGGYHNHTGRHFGHNRFHWRSVPDSTLMEC